MSSQQLRAALSGLPPDVLHVFQRRWTRELLQGVLDAFNGTEGSRQAAQEGRDKEGYSWDLYAIGDAMYNGEQIFLALAQSATAGTVDATARAAGYLANAAYHLARIGGEPDKDVREQVLAGCLHEVEEWVKFKRAASVGFKEACAVLDERAGEVVR